MNFIGHRLTELEELAGGYVRQAPASRRLSYIAAHFFLKKKLEIEILSYQ